MKSNRINYFDIAKGIGILCTIGAHMGRDFNNRIIHTFAMSLFFMISGYFMSEKKDFKTYATEKVKQLAPPYIFTCVCIMIICAVMNFVQGNVLGIPKEILKWILASGYGAGISYYEPFFIKQIGAIWFFLGIGWALIIVKYFAEKKYGSIIICAIAYMGWATAQYFWLPLSIQAGAMSSVFVYVGYMAKKEKFLDKPFNIWLFLLSMGMLIFNAHFNIRVVNVSATVEGGLLAIIGAILICYGMIWISRFIENKIPVVREAMIFFGQNSMIILSVHLLELTFVPWGDVYTWLNSIGIVDTPSVAAVFMMKVIYATICTFIILKIPALRKIFGK